MHTNISIGIQYLGLHNTPKSTVLKGVMRCCVAAEARTNDRGFCRQVRIRYHIRRYICSQSAIGNADGQILGSRKVCNLLLGDRVKMWLPPIISVMVLRWCVTGSGGEAEGDPSEV